MRTELRERYRRRVSHKRNVVRVRYLSQSREVSHLQLRVCYYFEKDAAGVIIHSSAHFVEVRKVAQMRRHAEAWQRLCQQRVGVAEHVARCHHVLSLLSERDECSRDSSHTRRHSRHAVGTGQCLHLQLQVVHRRVHHARVVGLLDASAESIRHHVGISKLVSQSVIHRHTQCAVSIALLKGGVDCNCLFLHDLVY